MYSGCNGAYPDQLFPSLLRPFIPFTTKYIGSWRLLRRELPSVTGSCLTQDHVLPQDSKPLVLSDVLLEGPKPFITIWDNSKAFLSTWDKLRSLLWLHHCELLPLPHPASFTPLQVMTQGALPRVHLRVCCPGSNLQQMVSGK